MAVMLKFSFAGNPNKSGTVVLDTQQVLICLKVRLTLGSSDILNVFPL